MSKTVVENEEKFETLVEAIQNKDGWTVDDSTLTDPNGAVAVEISGTPAEHSISKKGQGIIEWLIGTALVALGVLAAFILFAPKFIDAFNTQITAMIP